MRLLLVLLLVLSGCATPRIFEGLPDDPEEEVIYVIQPKRTGFSQATAEMAKSLGMQVADTELELKVLKADSRESKRYEK